MTVIIPEDFIQATINYASVDFESGVAATVLGFNTDLFVGGSLGDMATAIASAWADNVMPEMSEGTTLTGVTVVTETSTGEATAAIAGEYGTAQVPPNCAALLRKVTSVRGRRGRGRMYLPSMLLDGDVDSDGTISPERQTAIQTAVNDAFEAMETDGLVQVVLQNEEGITPPLTPPPTVLANLIQGKIGSQRGRNR